MDDLVGLTVGQVLAKYKLAYSDIDLIDEPPGRLWGAEVAIPEDSLPKRAILEIEPHAGLFSHARAWPQALVEQQKVIRVHTSREQLF